MDKHSFVQDLIYSPMKNGTRLCDAVNKNGWCFDTLWSWQKAREGETWANSWLELLMVASQEVKKWEEE